MDSLVIRISSGWSTTDVVTSTIALLKRSNQLSLLPSIISDLARYIDRAALEESYSITLARETDVRDNLSDLIIAKYAHNKGQVESRIQFDPALIGGFVLQYKDMRYDYSVRGLVEQLRMQWKETL